MLRRTHPEFIDSIDMLREKNLKKYSEIFTDDGERIGVALRFVHRPIEEVDPMVRLYRTYLVVQSILLGGPAYIPTIFVADYDPASNRVNLAANLNTLEEELWNREPDFVAYGRGVYEELAE